MKKTILILSCIFIMAMFAGCTTGKCDYCGKSGIVTPKTVFGITTNICSDCEASIIIR